MDVIKTIEERQKKPNAESFQVGDTVKVHFEIIEGKTHRVQIFEGVVLCFKNSGLRRTFTVRKISYGVGVERIFPVNSPRVKKVEIVRVGKVRRAKLYYVRDKIGKAAKVKELIGPKAQARIALNRSACAEADKANAAVAAAASAANAK